MGLAMGSLGNISYLTLLRNTQEVSSVFEEQGCRRLRVVEPRAWRSSARVILPDGAIKAGSSGCNL
ncbi:unnamed protein product, partial [Nesidiocoris tenuis]